PPLHAGLARHRGPDLRAGTHLRPGRLHHRLLHPAVVRALGRHAALRADAAPAPPPRRRPPAALVPDRAAPAGDAGRGPRGHRGARPRARRHLPRAAGAHPVAPEAAARVSRPAPPDVGPRYSGQRSGEERPAMPDHRGAPALLTRNLVFYLLSRFCSASAMTMLRAGVAWQVFSLTK